MPTSPQPKGIELLNATLVGAGLANTDKLKLFSNDITPDNTTVLADLTEADFTGYSAITLNGIWSEAQDSEDKTVLFYSKLSTYEQSDVTITNVVYGWYIVDTGGTILKAISRLETPVAFDAIGVQLVLKLVMSMIFGTYEDAETFT